MNNRLSIPEIAGLIAEQTGMEKKKTERFLKEFVAVVRDAVFDEKMVKVKGIGTFKIIEVQPRESVDVNTGNRIVIPGHYKFSFTPEKELRDEVNKPFSFFETVEISDHVATSDMEHREEAEEITVETMIPESITKQEEVSVSSEVTDLTDKEPEIKEPEQPEPVEEPEPEKEPVIVENVEESLPVEEATIEEQEPENEVEAVQETEEETEQMPQEPVAELPQEENTENIETIISEEESTASNEEEFVLQGDSIEQLTTEVGEVEILPEPETEIEQSVPEEVIQEEPQLDIVEQEDTDSEIEEVETPGDSEPVVSELEEEKRPGFFIPRSEVPAVTESAIQPQTKAGNAKIWWSVAAIILVFAGSGVFFFQRYPLNAWNAGKTDLNVVADSILDNIISEMLVEPDSLDFESGEAGLAFVTDTVNSRTTDKPSATAQGEDSDENIPTNDEIIATVNIKAGSRLTLIALEYYGHKVFWVYLYEYNKDLIKDPNNVPIGTQIAIPAPELYNINPNSKASIDKAALLQSQILSIY